MTDAEGVVLALLAARERRQAVLLLDRGDPLAPTSEDLVRIALVADVPDQAIVRRVEHVVQRDGEFHHAQTRTEMAAGAGDRLDQVLAQLVGNGRQLIIGDAAQVGWRVDFRQMGIAGKVNHLRIVGPAAGRGKGSAGAEPGRVCATTCFQAACGRRSRGR